MPKVSVNIPCFNSSKFIGQTIKSVLLQTYQDFEVIVMDDGSVDGTGDIVRSFKDARIKYFYKANEGLTKTRNRSIEVSSGKYIAFLDHDDIWLPDKLKKEMDLFEAKPETGLVYSDSFIIDESGKRQGRLFDIELPRRGRAFDDLLLANFIPILTAIVRRDILDEIGLFDDKFSAAEDWELFLRVAQKYDIDYVNEPLAEYRIHPASFSKNRILMLEEMNRIVDSHIKDCGPSLQKNVARASSGYKFALALEYLRQGDKVRARRAIREGLNRGSNLFKLVFGMCLSVLPRKFVQEYINTHTSAGGMHAMGPVNNTSEGARKIKVLYVIDSAKIGGAETYVANLVKYVNQKKFECGIFYRAGGEMADIYSGCAKYGYALPARTFFSLKAIRKLISIIEKEQVDIVHSVLFTSDFCACLAARMTGRHFVSTIVGFNFLSMGGGVFQRAKKEIESFFYRAVYIPAGRLMAVSNAVKHDLESRPGIKIRPDKIDVVYCGIPDIASNASGDIERRYAIGANDRIISCVATLVRGKGHAYLLKSIPEVLKKFPNLKVFFIGDGSERLVLEGKADILNIKQSVIFAGYLSEGDKDTIIKLSEAIVLPSFSEGCPTIVLEAMRAAKPVITTDVSGIKELVEDGQNALVVPLRNSSKLAEAMIKILSEKDKSRELGRRGRKTFEQRFTIEKMIFQHGKIYKNMLTKDRIKC